MADIRRGFHIGRGGGAGSPAGEMWRQTIGNNGTQSYGTKAAGKSDDPGGYVRRAAFSKPPETVGRKAMRG